MKTFGICIGLGLKAAFWFGVLTLAMVTAVPAWLLVVGGIKLTFELYGMAEGLA